MATAMQALTGAAESALTAPAPAICRCCGEPLRHTFVDLGMSPLCESYLRADQLNEMEPFYPLHVYVCEHCFLVQLQEYVSREAIFSEYAYFSSYSDSWLAHARRYADRMIEELRLTGDSRVVELASNDGYLLQYFVERGIPALGIEPAANVAAVAIEKGVPTLVEFFGRATARSRPARRDGGSADRQQRPRAGARPQRFRGRNEDSPAAARSHHGGSSSSHAPGGAQPVRHDLPRALLVFFALHGRADLRGARVDRL